MDLSSLTPTAIVELLDKHVHGQRPAKEALALAIRNRWRRLQLPADIRNKVKKQNLMLKGPTGSGKTALVRAIELELGWPVHFVDITQYSETGYKGKDLDEIISNFVQAYSEKPLPEWYVEELKSRKTTTAAEEKSNTKAFKDMGHAELCEMYARAFWYTVCVEWQVVDFPKDNPMVKVDGKELYFFDLLSGTMEECRDNLGLMMLFYRTACVAVPDTATAEVSFSDESIEFGRKLRESDSTVPLGGATTKLLSQDAGKTIVENSDYVEVMAGLQDRVSASGLMEHYQVPLVKDLEESIPSYLPWWLWASVIYDELIRRGAWRTVSNTRGIHRKRLNAKVRKELMDIYGFSADTVSRCNDLGDVFALALRDEKLNGRDQTSWELTMYFVKVALSRRITSKHWQTKVPHVPAITQFMKPIVGAETHVWENRDDFTTSVGDHVKRLRKLIRENSENYTVKHDLMLVWEDYLKVFEDSLIKLSTLSPLLLNRFIGATRPRPDMGEYQGRNWNTMGMDLEQYVRDSLAGVNSTIGGGDVMLDRETVIKFIQDYGICFLDEIDKIGSDGNDRSMITRDGVQRGLLALVEGAEYPIKSTNKFSDAVEYTFDTTNLMFVAAGAFSVMPVESLIPELRGRFPVVANINPLTKDNYVAILKLPTSQVYYASELMKVEGVDVTIDESGYGAMAEVCGLMNSGVNLGARRLESIVDRVYHEAMMSPDKFKENGLVIDKHYVYALDWSDTDLILKFENPDDKEPVAEKAS